MEELTMKEKDYLTKIKQLEQDRDTWKKACENLQEKLKDATPKFKVKEFVYAVFSDKDIFKGQIESYDYYSKCYLIFFNDDLGSEWIPSILVFKTKKDAEQYFYQQVKGENNGRTNTKSD